MSRPVPAHRPVVVHPFVPLADGILFDDLFGVPEPLCRILIARGLVWVTEFRVSGCVIGGVIIAGSCEAAADIALGRGLGEEVIGLKVAEKDRP